MRKLMVQKILRKSKNFSDFKDFLKSLSNHELHLLGKEIAWKIYDGCNAFYCYARQAYFESLERWQKEIYVADRAYCLFC